jgi:transcriptional regulator with XRE-family HTH domain
MLYASRVAVSRKARGLSQDQLAKMAGVSRGTIGNVEDGKTVPQSAVLWRIMTALEMRPDMNPEWSDEIEGWIRVIAPIIEQIPPTVRERVMLEVVARLGVAAREGR